ncbi:DoxX family protein [Aliifodinibius sp. S!AR15-10]|uniref:DoxX family protein n=1 Tax=Aliifodinibius sp. S!AR15-10 TaxID=2950437 RepID=UPI0028624188|nr:DoxX family protein [Aliifodinibius sp. S!AR15-10]MDR8393242.1 DoxX family protein [Aliifodinibius sp. S!AR15-10]
MDQLNKLSGIAHWLPRLSLASIFIYHGLPKITMTGDVAAMMGMPFIMVLLLGIVEVGSSLLMLWGGVGPEWATRIAGLLFTAVMIGAIVLVHAQYGWNSINMGNNGGRGMEFQVLIIAVSLLYAFKGNALNQKVEVSQAS